jgi:hypothetical protein
LDFSTLFLLPTLRFIVFEEAGIESKTVATFAFVVRHSIATRLALINMSVSGAKCIFSVLINYRKQ